MKFRVIHEDYWPVPETIQDDLTIDQARELLNTVQRDNPKKEYFICESKDESYIPVKGDFPKENTN
tara:strand:+ start:670 stop:867 length:198 start_codon:yes stop_codon:yes gene_type:complete